ncbi:MAG: carbohydrate ABC transporter permease [Acidiphilium sp.]
MNDIVTHPEAIETAPPRRRVHLLPYLLSLPALLVCIGILIPFFTAAWYSLEAYNMAFPAGRHFVGIGNYVDLFTSNGFWHTIAVSMIYMGASVILELLLGLGIALLLRERTKLNNVISVALLMPLMVAPVIASLIWKLMTNPNFGVYAWIVDGLGFTGFRWASSPGSAMFTVVLIDIWVNTPFIMILLLAGLRSLPTQPFEAAKLDGVPARFVFFRITLPMLMPYIITASLFRLLSAIQEFSIVYGMTQGGPGDSLLLFQIRSYIDFYQNTNVGRSSAILMVLWAITFVLSKLFVNQWHAMRQRSKAGA